MDVGVGIIGLGNVGLGTLQILAENAKPKIELIRNAFQLSRPYLY